MVTKNSSERSGSSNLLIVIQIVLLIAVLAVSTIQLYFFSGALTAAVIESSVVTTKNTPEEAEKNTKKVQEMLNNIYKGINENTGLKRMMIDAILEVEYTKLGSKEAFDTLTKANIITIKENNSIQQAQEFINSYLKNGGNPAGNPAGDENAPSEDVAISISDEQKEAILKDAYVEGPNANANIKVIEYSDMECPFCIKQHKEVDLKNNIFTKYGDKVAFIFKNNRGVDHPGTEQKALGALCAGAVGGVDVYVKFYEEVINGGAEYGVEKLPELAKKLGIEQKWKKCMDDKEMSARFAAETEEAASYGLRGTPGYIIMNTETGKYKIISGAYPVDAFYKAIDSL